MAETGERRLETRKLVKELRAGTARADDGDLHAMVGPALGQKEGLGGHQASTPCSISHASGSGCR